jgi:hypothetical protein
MRALSWKQPYATMMLMGKIETRSWATDYRGLVLICASQNTYTKEEVIGISGTRVDNLDSYYKRWGLKGRLHLDPDKFPTGVAIAVGELYDCRPMQRKDQDLAYVTYFPDLFCHFYRNVRAIKPFPFKGSMKWGKVTPEIESKIIYLQ